MPNYIIATINSNCTFINCDKICAVRPTWHGCIISLDNGLELKAKETQPVIIHRIFGVDAKK